MVGDLVVQGLREIERKKDDVKDGDTSSAELAERMTRLGQGLEAEKRFTEAAAHYSEALRIDPSFALASFRAGNLALRLGDYATAIPFLQHASELVPGHAATHFLLSKAYYKIGDYTAALAAAESTLLYDPSHSGAAIQRIRCLSELGHWTRILEITSQIPDHLIDSVEVALLRCLALAKLGHREQARTVLFSIGELGKKRFPAIVKNIEIELQRDGNPGQIDAE
jgi:tetratricopeptide (TPR) repeat protein